MFHVNDPRCNDPRREQSVHMLLIHTPVPDSTTRPSTRRAAGEDRSSCAPRSVASVRNAVAVSKLIFRKGDAFESMPRRLHAWYPPWSNNQTQQNETRSTPEGHTAGHGKRRATKSAAGRQHLQAGDFRYLVQWRLLNMLNRHCHCTALAAPGAS
jgi:hypothetical protein